MDVFCVVSHAKHRQNQWTEKKVLRMGKLAGPSDSYCTQCAAMLDLPNSHKGVVESLRAQTEVKHKVNNQSEPVVKLPASFWVSARPRVLNRSNNY